MVLAGMTYKGLLRAYKAEYGQNIPQLSKWLSGRSSPNYSRTRERGRQTLMRLEHLLKLNPGVLTERAFANAPQVLLRPTVQVNRFRAHHSVLVNDDQFHYMLRPLPQHLQDSFDDLAKWRRKDRIHVAGKGYIGIEEKDRWNSDKTVLLYLLDFQAFFGFLCLPKTVKVPDELPQELGATEAERRERYVAMTTGLGMRAEDLRFTQLVDHELLDRYVNFRKARNLHQGTTKAVAAQIVRHNSLLSDKTIAYLRRHPKLGAGLELPEGGWDAWCDLRYREMRDFINALNKTVLKQRTREPDEPVRHVFAQKDPAKVLIDLGRHLLATLPPPSCPVSLALQYRNATLLLLMTYEPLRASHWKDMRLGHEIYRDEGSDGWVLDIKASQHKNWIWGYAKDRFRVLPPELSEITDTYVHTHRPQLYKANATDLFLLKSKSGRSFIQNPGPQLTEQGFYNLIADLLQKYLGVPVGPHVVRHILVTDFLIKHPNDFESAGALINDSPETVKANYSHVSQKHLLATRDEEFSKYYRGLK